MEVIKIKYHNKNMPKIEKIAIGNWIDLRTAKEVFIKKGQYAMIPLGVSMELPEGYEAIVAPRSSTFKNFGVILVNSIGVIDNSFCGDNDQWQFLAYCLEPKETLYDYDGKGAAVAGTTIPEGTRICQFRIQKIQPEIEFVEVEHLEGKDRGGIGSTGTK